MKKCNLFIKKLKLITIMFILLWGCQIDDDVHIDSNNSVPHNHYKLEKNR